MISRHATLHTLQLPPGIPRYASPPHHFLGFSWQWIVLGQGSRNHARSEYDPWSQTSTFESYSPWSKFVSLFSLMSLKAIGFARLITAWPPWACAKLGTLKSTTVGGQPWMASQSRSWITNTERVPWLLSTLPLAIAPSFSIRWMLL